MKKLLVLLKSNFLKSSTVYTISNIINKLIPFFLLPILTRYLSPQDYGLVSNFGVLISLAYPFIGLESNSAVTRYYYDLKKEEISKYIFNSLLVLLTGTIFVSILFAFFSQFISRISSIPETFLWIVIIISIGQYMVRLISQIFQVQVAPLKYALINNLYTFSILALSIFLIVKLGFKWEGRIYGLLISSVLFILIILFLLIRNKWIKVNITKSYIKNILSYGIPLVPVTLSTIVLTASDRLFITNMIGLSEVGIYSVGYQFGSIINILAASFNLAFVPYLFKELKKNDQESKKNIIKITYVYFIVLWISTGILFFISPYLLKLIVDPSFESATIYIRWVALGYTFHGMYMMFNCYIYFIKKTYYITIITVSSALINIALNYILIKQFGTIGAAQATAIVYFLKLIIGIIIAVNLYKMPWLLRKNDK